MPIIYFFLIFSWGLFFQITLHLPLKLSYKKNCFSKKGALGNRAGLCTPPQEEVPCPREDKRKMGIGTNMLFLRATARSKMLGLSHTARESSEKTEVTCLFDGAYSYVCILHIPFCLPLSLLSPLTSFRTSM